MLNEKLGLIDNTGAVIRELIAAIHKEINSSRTRASQQRRKAMLGITHPVIGFGLADDAKRDTGKLQAKSALAINLLKARDVQITRELAKELAQLGFAYAASIARRHALIAESKERAAK